MNRREFLWAGAVAGGLGLGKVPGFGLAGPTVAESAGREQSTLRLDSNENSLGLAPGARAAVQQAIGEANRYPDEPRSRLVEALAARHAVEPGSVVLGNGSTEILQMIVQSAASAKATLMVAHPTFEAVAFYQRPFRYRVERVPLDRRYAHDVQQMRDRARTSAGAVVVYLCNPNNPTGTLTPSSEIDAWIAESPQTVLFAVDEAYFEYVEDPAYRSAVHWVRNRPNVVVTRTFSKIYGMAGLRLGYALAHPETARRLREFITWDNANGLAVAAALASLKDRALIPRSRAANRAARRIVEACLKELGLSWIPSHANFLMHRTGGDLDTYIRRMRDNQILVGRPFPPLLSHNRLSLGSAAEMERFVGVLRDFRTKGWV